MTRRRTCRGSAYDGAPSGVRMSQNIRAVPGASPRHGRIWKVPGSGRASMSDSATRAKPSIAEPSKPMPSSKAPSSSAGALATDLRGTRTSGDHTREKRVKRSPRGGARYRFEVSEHVGEPQPDEADVAFLQRAQHEFLLPIHDRSVGSRC